MFLKLTQTIFDFLAQFISAYFGLLALNTLFEFTPAFCVSAATTIQHIMSGKYSAHYLHARTHTNLTNQGWTLTVMMTMLEVCLGKKKAVSILLLWFNSPVSSDNSSLLISPFCSLNTVPQDDHTKFHILHHHSFPLCLPLFWQKGIRMGEKNKTKQILTLPSH